MSSNPFTQESRYGRAAVAVIIAALCIVPPLVRATFNGSTSAPIRLNRGFESPPKAKSGIAAPSEPILPSKPMAVSIAPRPDTRERSIGQPLPHPLHDPAPDAERGPPRP